jgi:hypothetical protein
MSLLVKRGAPVIVEIAGRRYAVCDDLVRYDDGSASLYHCGALIDVTDAPAVRVTASCGVPHNHAISGPDALVEP